MAVICISRELAANGEETARELAKLSGYRYIERDFIESQLSQHDIDAEFLKKYDEKKPGFFASMPDKRERFLHFLKVVLFSEAAKGDCIFLGRGGGAVLRGTPGVLSIRLIAPYEVRLKRLERTYGWDQRTAERHIQQSDRDRQGFYRFFFELDWHDSSNYDLTMNTGKITPAQAAEVIEQYRKTAISAHDQEACRIQLEEQRLKTAVYGEIMFTRNIRPRTITVAVKGSRVTLSGLASTREEIHLAEEAAARVPGVQEVVNDLVVMRQAASS